MRVLVRTRNTDLINPNGNVAKQYRGIAVHPIFNPTHTIMAYIIDAEKCTACAACADQCPSGAISAAEGGGHYIIDAEKCVDCAACEGGCPTSAISAGA